MWLSGNYSMESLAEIFKISKQTIKRYIELMSEIPLKKGA